MPKYRLLTLEELKGLEDEFVKYLVLNGIVAQDWGKMKQEDPGQANGIIDLFSDVVFESILRKTKFLESRTEKDLITIQCLDKKMVLVGMKAEASSEADFTDPAFIEKSLASPPKGIKVYTSEKEYKKQREVEIFELTESGFFITNDKLFKALCLAL